MSPVLHLVVCGARPAEQSVRAVEAARRVGFCVCVAATPAALAFIGHTLELENLTGRGVETTTELEPATVRPDPDAVLVRPLTFKTLNKWAAGINDNLAVGQHALIEQLTGPQAPLLPIRPLPLAGRQCLTHAPGYPHTPEPNGSDRPSVDLQAALEPV